MSEEQQRRARRAATGVRTAALWAAVKDLVTERAAALAARKAVGATREDLRLRAIADLVANRLAADGLTIHPRKVRLAPAAGGIPFLGYVVWPQHIAAGAYVRGRYLQRLRQHETGGIDCTEALQSYRAALAHTGATR